MTTTIQEIFEMRKNGQFEQAYEAVLPMYRVHHGHYTTLCMFWTATDVMRLRIEAGRCQEAEQILASLRHLYPNLQDKDRSAARTLNRLALLLATKEQEMKKLQREQNETMQFSLMDYVTDFGMNYLDDADWEASEWNGHPVPSFGVKLISRIFHEVNEDGAVDTDQLATALEFVQLGLQHAPRNKHLLRYQAILLYKTGEKQRAVALYRQLIERSKEAYLYSELAGMIEDQKEQAALLSRAIMNQRTEMFAQKDRLMLACLLKELFPQNAAYELRRVVELRDSLGQRLNHTILDLQKELADVEPANQADQHEFYQRMLKGYAYAA